LLQMSQVCHVDGSICMHVYMSKVCNIVALSMHTPCSPR
jgi:hypothetical protein